MNIKRSFKEQVRITGPMKDKDNAIAYCIKHNYTITRSGPLRGKECTFDCNRFGITAQRNCPSPYRRFIR